MKSRNGISKNFRFIIDDTTVLEFSFMHQALEEWTEEKWIYHTFDDGSKEQRFLHIDYYFKIDWSELITGEDSDKLTILRNAEFAGSKIELCPHTDVPGRIFDVITAKGDDGSQSVTFSQIINHRNSLGNKGTIMTFVTRNPHYSWDIVDPSLQQGVSTIGMEEFA